MNDMIVCSSKDNFISSEEHVVLNSNNTIVLQVGKLILSKWNCCIHFFDWHSLCNQHHTLKSITSVWSFCHLKRNSNCLNVISYRIKDERINNIKDLINVGISLN